MLRRLLISDFVLVERLELDFRAGFGALTGETGAGKSILLDALSLLLGERAEGGVVRSGCEKADLVAEFDLVDNAAAKAWLKDQDLEPEDDNLLVRRVVEASGRSRAYLNGMPATATQLREVGEFLADIHGQHAHQALVRPDAQRVLLDAHAGLSAQARSVSQRYREWQEAKRARDEALRSAESLTREHDLLAFQVKELTDLAFEPAAWEELNQEHSRLANSAELLEGAAAALDAVSEGDAALATQAERVAARLSELAGFDAQLGEVAELVSDAAIRLEEAGHALRRYHDRIDMDPQRLGELEQRIDAVVSTSRKYRLQPEGLAALLAESRERLQSLALLADPALLEAREKATWDAFNAAATKLSKQRKTAAAQLGKDVTAAMQDLAMAGGRFEIQLEPVPEGSAAGLERIEFLVAANPHQVPKSLAKVASGGELSRIGLAIQVITSEAQSTPTLIFDEVDVGIGGGVAEIVGRRLRELGRAHQVLCVTHLPQVAAQADWQWRVVKETANGQTRSHLVDLDATGRIEEIARMLGGVNITETTRNHAAELLGLN
jgi:DNA repair protein RecN (Recombination protein N)